jgi:hypothetical protein
MAHRTAAAFPLMALSVLLMACSTVNRPVESDRLSLEEAERLIIRQVSGSWETRIGSGEQAEPVLRCGGAMEVNKVVREPDGKLRFIAGVTDDQGIVPADEEPWSGVIDYQNVAENGRQLTICLRYDQEDRINNDGELAHWCMIMTGPDRYVWRERSWSFDEFTTARYRCK